MIAARPSIEQPIRFFTHSTVCADPRGRPRSGGNDGAGTAHSWISTSGPGPLRRICSPPYLAHGLFVSWSLSGLCRSANLPFLRAVKRLNERLAPLWRAISPGLPNPRGSEEIDGQFARRQIRLLKARLTLPPRSHQDRCSRPAAVWAPSSRASIPVLVSAVPVVERRSRIPIMPGFGRPRSIARPARSRASPDAVPHEAFSPSPRTLF